jgi:hypothetical protein
VDNGSQESVDAALPLLVARSSAATAIVTVAQVSARLTTHLQLQRSKYDARLVKAIRSSQFKQSAAPASPLAAIATPVSTVIPAPIPLCVSSPASSAASNPDSSSSSADRVPETPQQQIAESADNDSSSQGDNNEPERRAGQSDSDSTLNAAEASSTRSIIQLPLSNERARLQNELDIVQAEQQRLVSEWQVWEKRREQLAAHLYSLKAALADVNAG